MSDSGSSMGVVLSVEKDLHDFAERRDASWVAVDGSGWPRLIDHAHLHFVGNGLEVAARRIEA
jgi:hypothetical protein